MPLILICVLLTGCWDKVEIENKQLVSIIGVDTGEDIDKQKYLKNVKPEDPLTSIDLKKTSSYIWFTGFISIRAG